MQIKFGQGIRENMDFGPGVDIELTGDEVALAIVAFLAIRGIHINGPQTIRVNGELCTEGRVRVDPTSTIIISAERK